MEVSFEEEHRFAPAGPSATKKGLAAFLVRTGYARDEAQASKLLIGLIIVCLVVIAGTWLFLGGSEPSISPDDYKAMGTKPQPAIR